MSLKFTIELAKPGGYENGIETVLAEAETFAEAVALYDDLYPLWPSRQVLLCHGMRVIRRSDEPEA